MAAQVKLVRRCDFITDISSLSLYDDEEGFGIAWDGWEPTIAADGDLRVAEAMALQVQGDDHDDLADKLQALDGKIREVGWYADSVERYGIWLRTQLENETHARQALITEARGRLGSSVFNPSVSPGSYLREYQLALERTPWWEGTAYRLFMAVSLGCTGGMVDYTGPYETVAGTVPARIAKTTIYGVDGGGSGALYEFWFGFRTNRFGTAANFAPVWDLGTHGVGSNDTTTLIGDITAYGSRRAQCTFDTDETELKRIQISLQGVTTNYQDQRGSYIVLLRAKVGANTTCHVRLKDGFLYTSAIRSQPRVKITSTDWFLHALGTVNIPPSAPSRGILSGDFLRQYGFEIHASRSTGDTGYLRLDCLILIPCAEGSLHITGSAVRYVLGDARPATVMMTADDKMSGWSHQSNLPRASLTVEPDEYALPLGNDGVVVMAGQRETEHDLDDHVRLALFTYERWRTLRGAG